MIVRWFGQSAFLLTGSKRVLIDPFGALGERLAERGITFRHPPVEGVSADLVLVTHEHSDHNAVDGAEGSPVVIRSTAGTLDSPIGEIVAIASEHDDRAGTQRGPNTIFCFTLDGLRYCHLGDFGQAALRAEQRDAIGDVELLFVPIGGGPTIGGTEAAAVVRELLARGWAVGPGERFRFQSASGIRVTTAALEPADAARLADALASLRGPTAQTYDA